MKIRNINTNIIFNLPKAEVEKLITENPTIYEKVSKTKKKKETNIKPLYDQDCILPLIWEG